MRHTAVQSRQRFDIIVGNPPFNLKFDYRLSQEFYMDKAYDVLNPAGILMVIVPLSFMQNEFWEKTRVAKINSNFSFIGQTRLNIQPSLRWACRISQQKSWYSSAVPSILKCKPYNAEEFVSMDELKKRIAEVRKMKHRLRLQLMRECNHIDKEELEQFEYRLAKYMYELKAPCRAEQACRKGGGAGVQIPQPETAGKCHPGTDKGMGTQEADHRQGSRHHPQVHHLAERGAAQGSGIGEDILRLQAETVCPRLLDKVTHKAAGINDLILGRAELPMPENVTEKNMRQIRAAR